ncbi:MAG: preprotein translocase subunit SecG [Candidatus Omnitrophota bacterium]|nr:preprotein translocase subunit SecG [Candidatus Omnitrophota bacterium]
MGIPYLLVLIVHVLVSFLLIAVILVQGGRGGMTETLGGAAAQSLFGGGANIVMSRITAVGAMFFMVTCVTLAMLSTRQGRSVIEQLPMSLPAATDAIPSFPGVAPMPEPTAQPVAPETPPTPTEQIPAQ